MRRWRFVLAAMLSDKGYVNQLSLILVPRRACVLLSLI